MGERAPSLLRTRVRGPVVGVVLTAAALLAIGTVAVVRASADRVLPQASTLVLYEAEEGVVGAPTYVRDGDEVALPDRSVHDRLWAEWTAMVPPYWTRRVAVFEIASDGPGGVAASVTRLDDAGDRWLLSVDPVDATERPDAYLETLVHEVAHILTLGAGAVELRSTEQGTLAALHEACGGPAVPEGCAVPGTVLHRFVGAHWPADARDGGLEGDVEGVLATQYVAAPDSYVSAYAASGPAEDIAETFVALVLSHSQPSGSVAAEKVALLRSDPELFALADRIRVAARGR